MSAAEMDGLVQGLEAAKQQARIADARLADDLRREGANEFFSRGVSRLGLGVPATDSREVADEIARAEVVSVLLDPPGPPDWERVVRVLNEYGPSREAIRGRDDILEEGEGYWLAFGITIFMLIGAGISELLQRMVAGL